MKTVFYKYTVLAISVILILSCKTKSKYSLLPDLSLCDSAVVMFYKVPDSPRFFSYAKIKSTAFAENLNTDLLKAVKEEKKTCSTTGKVYFYFGKEAVETVYFSNTDTCSGVMFIKTGERYFSKISNETKAELLKFQKEAKELLPAAANNAN